MKSLLTVASCLVCLAGVAQAAPVPAPPAACPAVAGLHRTAFTRQAVVAPAICCSRGLICAQFLSTRSLVRAGGGEQRT